MKKFLSAAVFGMIAMLILPGIAGAVTITVHDQLREVSAVSRIYENWSLYDSSQDFSGNSASGAWSATAQAYVEYEYCALGTCFTGAYAQAEAIQVSDIHLAGDASSLAVDIFQYADSEVYNVVSPVANTYTDHYNFLGLVLELDAPAPYSLTLNADYTDASGNLPFGLLEFDGFSFGDIIFSGTSAESKTLSGQLEATSYLFLAGSDLDRNSYTGAMELSLLIGSGEPVSVPEPSTLVLLGAGLVGIGVFRRRIRV